VTPVVLGVAALAAAVGLAAIAARRMARVIGDFERELGQFSGAISAARAQAEVDLVRAEIESAQRVSGEVSRFTEARSELDLAVLEIKTLLVENLAPSIIFGLETMTATLKVIAATLSAVQSFMRASWEAVVVAVNGLWPTFGGLLRQIERFLGKSEEQEAAGWEAEVQEFFATADADRVKRTRQ
jgi:hypothetical protein